MEEIEQIRRTKNEIFRFHTDTNPQKDRVHSLRIVEYGENFGKGRFSKSVEVVRAVALDEDGTESPPRDFVLKEFTIPADWEWSKGTPGENALRNFNYLKQHRLKTWTTYRLSDDADKAIMTNGNIDGRSLLSANNTNLCQVGKELETHPIKTLKNFDQFMRNIFAEAKKAEKKKICIYMDSYGFFVEDSAVKSRISEIDFVIADMDNIEFGETESKEYEKNLQDAFNAMKMLLERYVERKATSEYLRQASSYLLKEYNFHLSGI